MAELDEPVYSIGAAAKILDVPAATLRAWEERYGVITPTRSEGSQRLYSRNQIEKLKYIKSRLDAGVSAADAHRLLAQQLAGGSVPAAIPDRSAEGRPLILLADRDQYAADLAEYFLRTEGYDVSIATDAAQARLLFAERSPDLVVADLSKAGTAQVLAVAAIDASDEALAVGASAFLRKPLEPLILVSTVRDLLGTSALARTSKRSPAPR